MNGIENITARITAEAEEYCRAVSARAEEQVSSILSEADAEVKKRSAAIKEAQTKECAAVLERASSSAEILKKTIMLDAEGKALDRAFELAHERLATVSGERYLAFLIRTLDAAVDMLGAPEDDGFGYEVPEPNTYTVVLSEADLESYSAELCKQAQTKVASKGCTLRACAGLAPGERGFILRRGEAEVNCTLSLMLKTARPSLEAEIYATLFPQAFREKLGKSF